MHNALYNKVTYTSHHKQLTTEVRGQSSGHSTLQVLFTVLQLQLQLLTTHLAVELTIQKDVPGGKVPVDEVLAGEVNHPICNLLGELQQEWSEVRVL